MPICSCSVCVLRRKKQLNVEVDFSFRGFVHALPLPLLLLVFSFKLMLVNLLKIIEKRFIFIKQWPRDQLAKLLDMMIDFTVFSNENEWKLQNEFQKRKWMSAGVLNNEHWKSIFKKKNCKQKCTIPLILIQLLSRGFTCTIQITSTLYSYNQLLLAFTRFHSFQFVFKIVRRFVYFDLHHCQCWFLCIFCVLNFASNAGNN